MDALFPRTRTTQTPTLSTTPTHMVREAAIPALPLNGRVAAKVIRQQIKDRIAILAGGGDQSRSDGTDGAGKVPGLGIVMANGWVCRLVNGWGDGSVAWCTLGGLVAR